ncbi:hypothetical protein MARINON1_51755 [Marinobacter salarius]|nr:hypothetical protein MBHK15_110988 [Marinobacter salarius]VXB97330.1 hypothetical protein MARINON1_51755 [Marinobacter salarius]
MSPAKRRPFPAPTDSERTARAPFLPPNADVTNTHVGTSRNLTFCNVFRLDGQKIRD